MCRAQRERRAGVAAARVRACDRIVRAAVSARRVRVVAHRADVPGRWCHRRRRMYGERQLGSADYAIRLPPARGEEVCLACQHTSMVQVSERGTLCEGMQGMRDAVRGDDDGTRARVYRRGGGFVATRWRSVAEPCLSCGRCWRTSAVPGDERTGRDVATRENHPSRGGSFEFYVSFSHLRLT